MVVLATEDTVQRASMLLSSLGELALLPPDSAEVGQFEARMRAFKAKMGDLSPHSAHVDGHEHDPGSPSLKYAATADSKQGQPRCSRLSSHGTQTMVFQHAATAAKTRARVRVAHT